METPSSFEVLEQFFSSHLAGAEGASGQATEKGKKASERMSTHDGMRRGYLARDATEFVSMCGQDLRAAPRD